MKKIKTQRNELTCPKPCRTFVAEVLSEASFADPQPMGSSSHFGTCCMLDTEAWHPVLTPTLERRHYYPQFLDEHTKAQVGEVNDQRNITLERES